MLEPSPLERAALVAALAELIGPLDADAEAICLALWGPTPGDQNEPGAALLDALASVRPVVAARNCPPTYPMIAHVDEEGRVIEPPPRPAGYVNPFRIGVAEQRYVLPDSAMFRIHIRRGHITHMYRCVARPADRGWRSACEHTSTAAS